MVLSKLIGDKKRWNQYRARTRQLPQAYRTALDALQHYVFYFASSHTDPLMSLLEDLTDLFEQAAANATPIRAVVGDDPVEFAEVFLRNYPEASWISTERDRLTRAIAQAEHESTTHTAGARR